MAGDLRLERRVDRLHALGRCLRLGGAPVGFVAPVQHLELLERLRLLACLGQLLGKHQSHVILIGNEVGELLQCAKRLVNRAGLLHAVGVLEEVLLGFALETLGGADLAELVVDGRASRRGAKHLVAQRDGVVEKTALGVEVDRLLVQGHGLRVVALPREQIAHAIIERDFRFRLLTTVVRVQHLAVHRDGLVDLLLRLEVGSLFLEGSYVGHGERRGT